MAGLTRTSRISHC